MRYDIYIYVIRRLKVKMLLHVSVQNDHHQGAQRLCFTEVINIKTQYTSQTGLDKLCSHIAELFSNNIFQMTILMFITLAKHKRRIPR